MVFRGDLRVSDRPNEKEYSRAVCADPITTPLRFSAAVLSVFKEKTMSLPNDPFMLLSYVNTMLRDKYASLDELCDDLDASKADITAKLSAAGFEYDANLNKFC